MNFKKAILSSISLLLTLIMVAGCTAPLPSTPDPTLIANEVNAARTEAAQTVVAQLTADAPLTPTATEVPPTETPTTPPPTETIPPLPTIAPTSTPFPTISYPTWTPTPTDYQCQIVSQSPSPGKYVSPHADLDARWTVKNSGTETWESSVTDYYYSSGSDIHKFDDRFDLPEDVEPGDEVDIIVDIDVPGLEGNYTETWVIGMGGNGFCTMTFTINVVE